MCYRCLQPRQNALTCVLNIPYKALTLHIFGTLLRPIRCWKQYSHVWNW
uniref:Uncharacterized protein n=1 Tax=Arundo donax TaxID=35708 RepID=A0A0A9AQM8_ARUDO